ncbi:uncharacterized protein DUF421 [Pedobacter cryoconitis]|uniref:Uncharacterized protein DUF421 n=2 Tax=Pedobacter cryoconitis TaxID=188932 RepID=A0A327SSC4_9SPHI|nr:uncharacterized protein DUF421 [Pedobacter cryoconitis]
MDIMLRIFGEGKDLNALNMGCRALVLYAITLIFIRISGTRTFSKKTAFDNIIVITIGALLSRVVVGASAFLPTVTAGFVLVMTHRVLAWASLHHKWVDLLIKGSERILYKHGKIEQKNLDKSLMSKGDLMESVRINGNLNDLNAINEARLERTGEISIIKKE